MSTYRATGILKHLLEDIQTESMQDESCKNRMNTVNTMSPRLDKQS